MAKVRKKAKAKPKQRLVAGRNAKYVDRANLARKKPTRKKVRGKVVTPARITSLDQVIHWRQTDLYGRMGEARVTFTPVVVPLRLLPHPVREHYTFKDVDLDYAMAYPGKPSVKGKVYFVVQRKDGLKEAWHKAPSPSLRNFPKYWQIDKKIKWYRPWPY